MAAKAEEPPPSPLPATDSLRDPPPPQTIGDISSSPLEKRAAPYADAEVEEEEEKKRGDEDEEPREAKRRRTFPAALDKISAVAAAPAASEDDDDDGSRSFSFQSRSIAPIEMTPKFGSFNSSAILGDASSPSSSPEVALEEEDAEKREANGGGDEGKDGN